MTRLNTIALEEYAKRFAETICKQHFSVHDAIKGEHLYEITAIPQLNLLLVYELHEKWQAEMKALKSDYFDFDNTDLQEGLAYFVNLVSQKIHVKRPVFEKLLQKNTKDTLRLLYVPQDYFQEIFSEQPDLLLTKDKLKILEKYTLINGFIPVAIGEKMGENESIYATQAIEWLDEILEKNADKLEATADTVTAFSVTEPFDEAEIVKHLRKPSESFFDSAADIIRSLADKNKSDITSFEAVETAKAIDIPIEESHKIVETTVEQKEVIEKIESKIEIAEPIAVEMPKIVEPSATVSVVPEIPPVVVESTPIVEVTLPSKANNRPSISSISQGVPLHQKFLFIQELFGGSPSQYEAVINELDNAPDYASARELLNFKFASKYLWDISSSTVGELLDLVKRRFNEE